MLGTNKCLKSLDLHWNLLSQTSVFEKLEDCKSLRQLDLSWNGLGSNK